MKSFSFSTLRLSILLSFQFILFSANAKYNDVQLLNDTIKNSDTIHLIGVISTKDKLENLVDDSIENELLDSGNIYLKNEVKENVLLHFIESDKFKNDFKNKKVLKRIYGKLAKIFAKKKYYPIAMQYYYEALAYNNWHYQYKDTVEINKSLGGNPDFDDNNITNIVLEDTIQYSNTKFLSNSFQQGYVNKSQSFFSSRKGIENESEPIKEYAVSETFDDGKNPVAYAIIIHVKQPKTGRRKAFTGINNVGHTFITLLKYNSDSTCVSHSFGFYPQKDDFFSATPLHPASSSVFKDDTVHDWDEAVGKFISERRFKKLIKLIAKFENKKYDLNNNNCTDFGLYAANVAGILIGNTVGSWPLGRGNNPANAGQSILEGKFINTDTGNTQGLFICADLK